MRTPLGGTNREHHALRKSVRALHPVLQHIRGNVSSNRVCRLVSRLRWYQRGGGRRWDCPEGDGNFGTAGLLP